MLYPKNTPESLDPRLFEQPTAEYRGAPFWAWNTRLDLELLLFEIDRMQEMGLGGFHIHSRSGLATPYLGEEYLRLVRVCVDRARERGMLCWLYDEDRWPSGAGGGFVTKDHAFRMRYLLFTPWKYGDRRAAAPRRSDEARLSRSETGRLLARYEVGLAAGRLAHYRMLADSEAAAAGTHEWFAYLETATDQPWYNNQAYVDTLSKAAIERFISITHERYRAAVGEEFGKTIPAIFTDEPQFTHKQTLGFAEEERDVVLPYTEDFEESYREAYGEELMPRLPELFWEPAGEVPSIVRYRYHDHVAERFASAFADTVGSWCARNNLMLTGHMMEEPTLESQTRALGEAMRSYRSFQLPGIDLLCDRRELTTAKQAQSAAHQFGAPGVLSELYGVTGWHFDFRGHKLQGDWQAALGVTVRVHHLTWVSMEGEAKRDYPASIGYQSPWHREYPMIEDHFARLNTALTRGEAIVRIAVVHPVESYWLFWGPREQTALLRDELEANFSNITNWLLFGQLDFDYLAESLLAGRSGVEASRLVVGRMRYDVVVVPACRTLRSSTLELLRGFRDAGGTLLFAGGSPALLDALPSEEPARLAARSLSLPFSRSALLSSLEPFREVEVRRADGSLHDNLIYQLRSDGARRWLFLSHVEPPVNPDLPTLETLTLRIRGAWRATLFDTTDGTSRELSASLVPRPVSRSNRAAGAAAHSPGADASDVPGRSGRGEDATRTGARADDDTVLTYELAAYDSLLIALDPARPGRPAAEAPGSRATRDAGTHMDADPRAQASSDAEVDPQPEGASAASLRSVPVNRTREAELLGRVVHTRLLEGPAQIELSEPNVLLLDRAEYALDGGEWREQEEILRLDNLLRSELGWPLRGRQMAQPWVEPEDSANLHRLALRFRIDCELELSGARLAVERAPEVEVLLNGKKVSAPSDGWFVDRSIGTIRLPLIPRGANELVVGFPIGRRSGAEWCYLLGDFGVVVEGAQARLTTLRRRLAFGDWTRQGLPFYAGNVTYRLELSGGGSFALQVPQFRNPVLSVRVDGREVGRIAYSPYLIDLGELPDGRHALEITAFGNRANAFGPIHNANDTLEWLGPQAWRTEGDAWSYEHRLRPTGVLVSPRLLELE